MLRFEYLIINHLLFAIIINAKLFIPYTGTCLAGQYSNITSNGLCTLCPVGSYQPAPDSSECLQCEAGYTTDEEGQTNTDSCIGEMLMFILHREQANAFGYSVTLIIIIILLYNVTLN